WVKRRLDFPIVQMRNRLPGLQQAHLGTITIVADRNRLMTSLQEKAHCVHFGSSLAQLRERLVSTLDVFLHLNDHCPGCLGSAARSFAVIPHRIVPVTGFQQKKEHSEIDSSLKRFSSDDRLRLQLFLQALDKIKRSLPIFSGPLVIQFNRFTSI